MKIAPFVHAINEHNAKAQLLGKPLVEHILVHTGQHYDDRMSLNFFEQLNIPQADINLGVGSGTHAEQVGQTMMEFEKVLKQHKPNWVVVVGDVNATLACSVTAKKEWVKCCHIEAGLRSGDITMPEEVNRLVTDRLSDLLLTPDELSSENLRREGTPEERIVFVGNIMIDTLEANRAKAESLSISKIIHDNQINQSINPPIVIGAINQPACGRQVNQSKYRMSKSTTEKIISYALGSLLAFLALNAFGGGFYGMSGAEGVPLELLDGSPFTNYFIPSLFLFVVVGGSALLASIAVFANSKFARLVSLINVIIVFGWLTVQVIIIGYLSWLQPATALISFLTLILIWLMPKQ